MSVYVNIIDQAEGINIEEEVKSDSHTEIVTPTQKLS